MDAGDPSGPAPRAASPILSLGRFVPGQSAICRNRRAADVDRFTARVSGRLARLRPSPLRWSYLVAPAVLAWALDFADLVMSSVPALGSVPSVALVFGFLAVQASIALQVVPGGAGLA
jgi:putative heme transporter